jgi:hypothetical protein
LIAGYLKSKIVIQAFSRNLDVYLFNGRLVGDRVKLLASSLFSVILFCITDGIDALLFALTR